MFLSRVEIDWSRARNPYDLHRSLWSLFPDRPDAERDFLFHIEDLRTGRGARVLMQSQIEPSATGSGLRLVAKKAYALQLRQGQRLRFLLSANPVKTVKDQRERLNAKGAIKTCRVPLIKEDEQRLWLERKLDGAARLESTQVRPNPPLYFRKQGQAGKIVPVTFEGVLTVDEPGALMPLIQKGIGPAKAFGCGLLLLRRASACYGP